MECDEDCLVFDGVYKKWAIKHIKKEYWRFKKLYEFDDLLQDACVKFLQCRKQYPHVTNPRHLMALYKRALCNHLHDLATSTRTASGIEVPEGCDWNEGWLLVLMREAPPELQLLLVKMQDPSFCELIAKARGSRRRGMLRRRESINTILCRMLGLDDSKVDLLSMARQHFGEDRI